ncbi:MAG: hypothetical protein ACKVS9_07535 [Phycisphaerae bacterium]
MRAVFQSSVAHWIAVAVAALGLVLIVVALLRRRRGTAMHCRKCDYDLTGCESQRCPECGTGLNARTMIRGARRRGRRRIGAVGLLLICASTSPWIAAKLSRAQWLTIAPLSIVVERTQSADIRVFPWAQQELRRRIQSNSLSASDRMWLIERLLAIHERGQFAALDATMFRREVLDDLRESGLLAEPQLKRLLEASCQQRILARRMIAAGAIWPGWAYGWICVPQGVHIEEATEVSVDGGELQHVDRRAYRSGLYSTGTALHQRDLGIGTHRLRFVRTWTARAADRVQADASLHAWTQMHDIDVTVVEPEQMPLPVLRDGVELDIAVRRCIDGAGVAVSATDADGVSTVRVQVRRRDPLPIAVAFDVIALVNGQEHLIGGFACDRGEAAWNGQGAAQIRLVNATRATVILRPSIAHADELVDPAEIWSGTIRFEDLAIQSGSMPTIAP